MNSHILQTENNIWWGKWYMLGSKQQRGCDFIPSTMCGDKQTNKHKRVGQVKLLPMKHSWEGKKKSSMVHSWQTGTRRLWHDPFHHVQRQKKQTQKSWTNQNPCQPNQAFSGSEKRVQWYIHTWQTARQRLWLDPFHHVWRQKKETQ